MDEETKQHLEELVKKMRAGAAETQREADKIERVISEPEPKDESYYPYKLPFRIRLSFCWFLWAIAMVAIFYTLFSAPVEAP